MLLAFTALVLLNGCTLCPTVGEPGVIEVGAHFGPTAHVLKHRRVLNDDPCIQGDLASVETAFLVWCNEPSDSPAIQTLFMLGDGSGSPGPKHPAGSPRYPTETHVRDRNCDHRPEVCRV